jgi:hypothetical protein
MWRFLATMSSTRLGKRGGHYLGTQAVAFFYKVQTFIKIETADSTP